MTKSYLTNQIHCSNFESRNNHGLNEFPWKTYLFLVLRWRISVQHHSILNLLDFSKINRIHSEPNLEAITQYFSIVIDPLLCHEMEYIKNKTLPASVLKEMVYQKFILDLSSHIHFRNDNKREFRLN